MNNGVTLYLLPCTLGEDSTASIPNYVKELVTDIEIFFVENERSARRYLRSIGYKKNFDEVKLLLLDKHQKNTFIKDELQAMKVAKKNAAVLSEAGLPCIADPGNEVVKLAHQLKIKVDPLVGPSSILLALIASGMNGQSFTFHGYLPLDSSAQLKKIKEMESLAIKTGYTQLFMETPYRNNKVIETILQHCPSDMLLSIACDLTLPTQYICTQTMAQWKQTKIDIHKRPAIFSINRNY